MALSQDPNRGQRGVSVSLTLTGQWAWDHCQHGGTNCSNTPNAHSTEAPAAESVVDRSTLSTTHLEGTLDLGNESPPASSS